jgi:SMC interacting uncharacterized protein involved in chromosome segregation
MGTFAKIFIVVNLVLAVVFLGAAAALLGTAESWKQHYTQDPYQEVSEPGTDQVMNQSVKDRLTTLEDQLSKATDERDRYQSELVVQSRRATELEKKVAEKSSEFTLISGKYNEMAEDFKVLKASFDDMKANYKEAFDENKKLQGQVDTALAETAQAKQDADDLRIELEKTNGNLKTTEDDLRAQEKMTAKLEEECGHLKSTLGMVVQKFGPNALKDIRITKALSATVQGVDEELNIVLISIGSDEGVEEGYTFTVYRGSQYIGQLIIDKVGGDWASGHMDKGLMKEFPQRGDEAATQL